jgi:hypothetical protein
VLGAVSSFFGLGQERAASYEKLKIEDTAPFYGTILKFWLKEFMRDND